MAARGQYAKGIARQSEILEKALDVVARDGYSKATIKQIADAAGLSQNGLLHHFGSKEALFTEILRRRDDMELAKLAPTDGDGESGILPHVKSVEDLAAGITQLLRHNASVPGLVHLYTRLSNEATEPSHPSHLFFGQRYRTVRHNMCAAFEDLDAAGALPPPADPAILATLLIALIDGLQTQWTYDDQIDIAEHIEYFLDLLTRNAPRTVRIQSSRTHTV